MCVCFECAKLTNPHVPEPLTHTNTCPFHIPTHTKNTSNKWYCHTINFTPHILDRCGRKSKAQHTHNHHTLYTNPFCLYIYEILCRMFYMNSSSVCLHFLLFSRVSFDTVCGCDNNCFSACLISVHPATPPAYTTVPTIVAPHTEHNHLQDTTTPPHKSQHRNRPLARLALIFVGVYSVLQFPPY